MYENDFHILGTRCRNSTKRNENKHKNGAQLL